MTQSFADLKRKRKSMYDKIKTDVDKINKGSAGKTDDRLWKRTVDKAGNGNAVIRFLPPSKGEDVPFVRIFDHGFQGPGGWYIENSLTTLNKDDPVSEYNSKLWNRGDEAGKDQARKQKRRLKYFANVMVVADPGNPENEGKVFLYQFGKKIFDKINDAMYPEEDPIDPKDPINPFDLWEGANFKLKARQVEGFRNYDKSEFDDPSAISDNDDDLEKIWGSQYSLQDILGADKFKSYAELEARLNRVLGTMAASSTAETLAEETPPSSPEPRQETAADDKPPFEVDSKSEESSEDDSLEFFKSLADDDD